MPNHTSFPPPRLGRSGSSTQTIQSVDHIRAIPGVSPYPTLLLKGSRGSQFQSTQSASAIDDGIQKEVARKNENERKLLPEEAKAIEGSGGNTHEAPDDRMVVDSLSPEPELGHLSQAFASTSASASPLPFGGAPSQLYAPSTPYGFYQPQLDKTRPDPAQLPPTPRAGQLFLRQRFPLEEAALALSPRAWGKQSCRNVPSGSDAGDKASASSINQHTNTQTQQTQQTQHDEKLRGLAEAATGESAAVQAQAQAQRQFAELNGEVAKILRKMYHLAWEQETGGAATDEANKQPASQQPANGPAPNRSKPNPNPVQRIQDIYQTSQESESRSEHQAHASGSAPHEPSTLPLPRITGESKAAAIRRWVLDTQAQLAGSPELAPPLWVLMLGAAPSSEGETGYEQTLVGDAFELPTKLPADDNPEDEVDRVSLTAELPIHAWICELTRRTDVSPSQLKVAACYMIALRPHVALALRQRQEAAHAIAMNQPMQQYRTSPLTCPRRTLVGALILASKFLGEKVYAMSAWARVTGLEAPDLVQSEQAIGTALKWDLWVGANIHSLRNDVFTRTLHQLISNAAAQPAMAKPYPQEMQTPQVQAPLPPPREMKLEDARLVVPAAHEPQHTVPARDIRWSEPSPRKRAASQSDSAEGSSRPQKRQVLDRVPSSTSGSCGSVMVKHESMDEQPMLTEAY